MGLFGQSEAELQVHSAKQRMQLTRERGTKRLVLGFLSLIAVAIAYGKIKDTILLQQKWEPLAPDIRGLSVVGTLDGRSTLDRNLFRILQANNTTRVELTDFGWKSIFSGGEGGLNTPGTGDMIEGVLQVDNETGYAMMIPFLRYGVAKWQEKPEASGQITAETPVEVTHADGKTPNVKSTLGALIKQYEDAKADKPATETDASVGGSASGREVEHGRAIPGDTLVKSCPVVLTGAQFTGAELEKEPSSVLVGTMYKIRLHLNKEGRSRFYQWSRSHIDENLVFVLNGQVLTAGKVKQELDVNDWEISNVRDEGAAKSLVDFVNSKKG